MLNNFAGLEMSKRALNAFRRGIEVAGHNVANVKTEGYSRQRVNLSTTDPYAAPGLSSPAIPGQIGTGVKVDEIIRIRDEFLDFQYRSELSSLGYWYKINKMYDTVQLYISEPQGDGVRAAFDTFWAAVNDLQANPESPAIRRAMVESAKSLGSMIDSIIKGYDEYASMVNAEVKAAVDEANGILHDIASLNKQIYSVKASGQNPNDLLDKRDLLLDRLSKMIDIDIQEPFKNGDITGEFFITLNGRTLVQGDKVRELVAHAFQWENKTYYDVQVKDNEFDIVEDPNVALALATGPEGVHQLDVHRLANGEEWTVGGHDALCLNPNGSLKTLWTSKTFPTGFVLTSADAAASPYTFTVSSGGFDVDFTLTWNSGVWDMTAAVNGTPSTFGSASSATGDLTVDELAQYMQDVFDGETPPLSISATPNSNSTALVVTSDVNSVDITVPTGMTDVLGMTKGYVYMRVRPSTTTEALGLSTSFRIQVGSQGTQVMSKLFTNTGSALAPGEILGALGAGQPGDSYTFRVGAHDYQLDVTVTWDGAANGGAGGWTMTTDTGAAPVTSATNHLTVAEMSSFLASALPTTGNSTFLVNAGTPPTLTQFSISSVENWLMSISDVKGDLAARMGMVNTNPVITIDVDETDSLETIRNKINEKYQEAYGLTHPEQWVHASLAQDGDQTWYLTIASDVAGEAQRITLMGDEDGNMQTLRRLGLVKEEYIGTDATGQAIYREVTSYANVAEDAFFTFDGVNFISADNKFDKARRVPSGANRNDFSASKLETVSEGIWLELKNIGRTAITVQHHVKDGSIKAMEDIRDGLIPQLKGELDEIAWALVNNFNAYQYSGYGIGDNLDTTGVEFFNRLRFKSGSASLISVYDAIDDDVSLVGAAMGRLDGDGKAVYGKSSGSGSGVNAGRMASLKTDKLLSNGSASLGDFYEAYLAKIGSEAGRASLMHEAQKNLTEQIDAQRQSVMGVNIDEEMLDILMWNQAFNAMSRYATTIDEMLDRIINGFGIVGR
jgi:flagellar hook-associated protein FlgK